MRFLLLMCSVELGVHLREVLRSPLGSSENESNREIHFVNIFQLLELCIEFFQSRMAETDESCNGGSPLETDEKEEVLVMEALVENIQVVVDFLEAEPIKDSKDEKQYTRLCKYFISSLRLVCCFCSLQLPVLEERVSYVVIHSWNTILDQLEVFLKTIDGTTLFHLISWTRFGVMSLVEHSKTAEGILEQEIFSRVFVQLLQEFRKHSGLISSIPDSLPVHKYIQEIIELLAFLYEFPKNQIYIREHDDMLRWIQRQWPSERLEQLLVGGGETPNRFHKSPKVAFDLP